jgi:hypothetical protein
MYLTKVVFFKGKVFVCDLCLSLTRPQPESVPLITVRCGVNGGFMQIRTCGER